MEYDLLEVCRTIVCRSGIFELELEKAEVQFGDGLDNDQIMHLNENFMGTIIDKLGNQEKKSDHQLMQLALIDIASKHNECYKAVLENNAILKNETIAFIAGGQKSFKTVTQIIRMKSDCFMKPFQL